MTNSTAITVHATTLCLNGTGVLIRGPSGAGKSDLALQLLETLGNGMIGQTIEAVLVADDQTLLVREGDVIFASAPHTIKGLLEVRGQGILKLASRDHIPLALVVELNPEDTIERMPEAVNLTTKILGVQLPSIAIDPSKASAAARVRVAWARTQNHTLHRLPDE